MCIRDRCEGSLYKLATMDPTEFPELPRINVENSIQIEQNVLKNMIRRTIFAVSNEEKDVYKRQI